MIFKSCFSMGDGSLQKKKRKTFTKFQLNAGKVGKCGTHQTKSNYLIVICSVWIDLNSFACGRIVVFRRLL